VPEGEKREEKIFKLIMAKTSPIPEKQ